MNYYEARHTPEEIRQAIKDYKEYITDENIKKAIKIYENTFCSNCSPKEILESYTKPDTWHNKSFENNKVFVRLYFMDERAMRYFDDYNAKDIDTFLKNNPDIKKKIEKHLFKRKTQLLLKSK